MKNREYIITPVWCQEVYSKGEILYGWLETDDVSSADGWGITWDRGQCIATRTPSEAFDTADEAMEYAKVIAQKHPGDIVMFEPENN